jgi:phenol 2-monooxygenase (NADPH)
LRAEEAKPTLLGLRAVADGRWRLYSFAGSDALQAGSLVRALFDFLLTPRQSPMLRHTPAGENFDTVLDVCAINQASLRHVVIGALPELLLPRQSSYGRRDYGKVYCFEARSDAGMFAMLGVVRVLGALVSVRSDQHIRQLLPLDAHDTPVEFF